MLGLVAVVSGLWGREQIRESYLLPAIQRRLEHEWNEAFFNTKDPHGWRVCNDPIATAHGEGRAAYVYGRVGYTDPRYHEYQTYLEQLVKEGRDSEKKIRQEFECK